VNGSDLLLIVANVLAFGYEIARVGEDLIIGGGSLVGLMDAGALIPSLVWNQHEYWRIVTSAFLHGSAMHLAVNMYSLWAIGRFVEIAAGTPRMVTIYVASLLTAGFAIVQFGYAFTVTVGASGAIFGLLGALFAIGLKSGSAGMELVRANIGVLVINLIITFTIPGISALGHIGGLVGGFVVTWLIFARPPVTMAPVAYDNRS